MRTSLAFLCLGLTLTASSAFSSSSDFLLRRSQLSHLAHRSAIEEAVSASSSDFTPLNPDEYITEEDDDGEFLDEDESTVLKRATSTSSYAVSYYFDDSSVKTACKRWKCKCINYVPTNTALKFTSASCVNADSDGNDSSGEALAYCLFTSSTTGAVQNVKKNIASLASFTSCD